MFHMKKGRKEKKAKILKQERRKGEGREEKGRKREGRREREAGGWIDGRMNGLCRKKDRKA